MPPVRLRFPRFLIGRFVREDRIIAAVLCGYALSIPLLLRHAPVISPRPSTARVGRRGPEPCNKLPLETKAPTTGTAEA